MTGQFENSYWAFNGFGKMYSLHMEPTAGSKVFPSKSPPQPNLQGTLFIWVMAAWVVWVRMGIRLLHSFHPGVITDDIHSGLSVFSARGILRK